MTGKRSRNTSLVVGLATCVVVAACWSGGPLAATHGSAPAAATTSPAVGASAVPTATSEDATGSDGQLRSPSALGTTLHLSGVPTTSVELPTGAEVNPLRLVADRDWVIVAVDFESAAPSGSEAIYAINIRTGKARGLLDTTALNPGFLSLAGSQAAWIEWTCAATGGELSCATWTITLANLDTGASRVVVQGVHPEVASPGGQGAEPIVPALALSSDTLAYSSGDHIAGFRLNLLTLSTGAARTFPLAGPIEEIRWAGSDLAWIEATGYQPAPSPAAMPADNSPWYSGTRLMLLPSGAGSAKEIDSQDSVWLAGSPGRIVWDRGGDYLWSATAPTWQPAQSRFIADSPPSLSDGWMGWLSTSPEAPFLVVKPGESVPRAVPNGIAISGGWLFLGAEPGTWGPTRLEAVRLSAVP
jgi:hypothetical protein